MNLANIVKKAILTGTAIAVLGAGSLACKRDYPITPTSPSITSPAPTEIPTHTPTEEPTPSPTETPEPTPTQKSTYELALEKLDYKTAQHWKDVARNYNSEQAINELIFIPEEGRLVLAEDIKAYTADKNISDKELSDLADPDRDGEKSSDEANNGTNPMDPSNANQEISQKTFSFVRGLIKYRNSVSDDRLLPEIYSGLKNVIYVVENQPKIVSGLNIFGNDALAFLLSDNQDIDMSKYWFLTNATALQAQDFFYIANEIYANGDYKEKMQGPLTNKRFDEKEREITNFRLSKQIEWQGSWSTPLEYEEAVKEYGSEQRTSNALRWRVLPYAIFKDDIVNGGLHPSRSAFDTNAWLVVASYNNENSEEVREDILARLNDPQRYEEDVDRIKRLYEGRKTLPNTGPTDKKASEYINIIFSEGKPYEIAGLLMYLYSREQIHHDNAVSLSALWTTLVGASGGTGGARIIHPEGHETGDGQSMFTLSKDTERKLEDVFLYRKDELSQLLGISEEEYNNNPRYRLVEGLFGNYSNIAALIENGAKYFGTGGPSGRYVRIPLTK
jgi:hypothetical protein